MTDEPTVVAVALIPLSKALICVNCEGIQVAESSGQVEEGVPQNGGSATRACRGCGAGRLMPLAAWLGSVNSPYDQTFPSIQAWAEARRERG